MKLLYQIHKQHKPEFPNFGDELNLWIWPELIPELLDDDDRTLFVGIGTVLDDTLPADPMKIVFGTGNGYRPVPIIDDKYRIYCVRGPLTAQALKLPPSVAVTDPAILIRKFVEPPNVKASGVVLMGHYTSALHGDWTFACDELGYRYVHPLSPMSEVIGAIQSAELVVTEAMHGAIVADALRVPWVPVITSASECRFKWDDYTKSVGLTYNPIRLPSLWDLAAPPATRLAKLRLWVKRKQFVRKLVPNRLLSRARLSTDAVIASRTSRLLEEVERLRADAVSEGWISQSASVRQSLDSIVQ